MIKKLQKKFGALKQKKQKIYQIKKNDNTVGENIIATTKIRNNYGAILENDSFALSRS